MSPAPFAVEDVERETHDTVTLTLVPPQGDFAFAPGQFNMLYAFGAGEVPISISGDPRETGRLVHTVRAVGAVTRALATLAPGDGVGVRGPFGKPWPIDDAKGGDVVVIAGGIGLAPLRPAVHAVLHERSAFRRAFLLYGTRTPKDILFDEELIAWRGRFDFEVEVTVDRGENGWRGRTGVVTPLIEHVDVEPEKTSAFICGPEVMMRFSARALVARGVPASRIYVTLERNMQCGIAWCGHCQLGGELICRDGPVYRWDRVERLLAVKEV